MTRTIAKVARVRHRRNVDEDAERKIYWASRSPQERFLAVEELRAVSVPLIRAINLRALGGAPIGQAQLAKSRERTKGFLFDARAHLSEIAEATCEDRIRSFEEYVARNELELALDMLDDAFEKSGLESWRVLELMALAAASMGLHERQHQYDEVLSEARGYRHTTVLQE